MFVGSSWNTMIVKCVSVYVFANMPLVIHGVFCTHTLFDMFEELMANLYCALMLCVLSCLAAIELCFSLIFGLILSPFYCY